MRSGTLDGVILLEMLPAERSWTLVGINTEKHNVS
jgi:hypothetical protein